MIKTTTEGHLEGQGLCHFTSLSCKEETRKQELTEVEAREGHCLLACSSWLAQSDSFTTQDHLFEGGITHSGLGHPLSISNQENAPGLYAGNQTDRVLH